MWDANWILRFLMFQSQKACTFWFWLIANLYCFCVINFIKSNITRQRTSFSTFLGEWPKCEFQKNTHTQTRAQIKNIWIFLTRYVRWLQVHNININMLINSEILSTCFNNIQRRRQSTGTRGAMDSFGGAHTWGARGARAYNWGLGAEPPAGPRCRAHGQGVRGSKPPWSWKLLALGRATDRVNLYLLQYFQQSIIIR